MSTTKCIPLVEPWFLSNVADEVKDQIQSGFIGPGRRTQEFSQALVDYTRAPHCLLTVSGTAALSVAAIGLGLKPGDEILVPAYGVISTINAFASIGLKPRLVEIERHTGCMSPKSLREALSAKTQAVCFVNFTGYTGENLVEVKQICDEKGIPLIEDSACAIGHHYQGTSAGLFGTVGTFSFSVPKLVTTGQGGAILTHDQTIFKKAAAYIDQGDLEWRKTQLNRGIGTNLRFNDILAAFGCAQMKNLEILLKRKSAAHQALKSELEGQIYSVPGSAAPLHNIIFPKEPEKLKRHLKEHGIGAGQFYRTISTHPAYYDLGRKSFPHADFWTKTALFLPFGLALTEEDMLYIRDVIKSSGVALHQVRDLI